MFDDNDFSKFSNLKVKYFILKTQALEREFDKNILKHHHFYAAI